MIFKSTCDLNSWGVASYLYRKHIIVDNVYSLIFAVSQPYGFTGLIWTDAG